MTEKEAAAGSSSEKLSQLQKTLTASEHDRRILQASDWYASLYSGHLTTFAESQNILFSDLLRSYQYCWHMHFYHKHRNQTENYWEVIFPRTQQR